MIANACARCGNAAALRRLGVCPACFLKGELEPALLGESLELLEEIGRGGMGCVYRARHRRLDRTVAVKFLPEELADRPEFRARFEREAKALAMLSHPGIVTVYDFGQEGHHSYIVMEFVEGRPLSERVPMPPDRAIDVARQVCEALSYAHQRGVVHRDIKPANILLDAGGRVKVTDFGIARLVHPEARGWTVTGTMEAIGTPHYMAPEASRGAAPDARMDVYSVGVMLYEMITGRLPQGDFAPLPGGLDAIVRQALAAEPERRYQTIDELRAALASAPETAARPEALPADEMSWVRAVALLQSISTFVALAAFYVSVKPRKIDPDEFLPFMIGRVTLPNGETWSRVRFEPWWTLAAIATFALAIVAYGFLRRHWRLAGLERPQPEARLRESHCVFWVGVVACAVFSARLALEWTGHEAAVPFIVPVGGLIEVTMLYFFWIGILQAWRISRPLRREPLMWAGLGLSLVPPATNLVQDVLAGWPPP